MKHPLARIFMPIAMIVVIATSSVAISTAGNTKRIGPGETTLARAMTGAEGSQAIMTRQTGLNRP